MERVKVTQEQAEAIEKAIRSLGDSKDNVLRYHSENGGLWHSYIHELDDMDISKLAKALYIGYEVEPEFKVGDWVRHDDGYVGKITEITEYGLFCTDIEFEPKNYISTYSKYFSYATPSETAEEKERRWWKKHGRKIFELKKGDTVISNTGCLFFVEDSNGISVNLKASSLREKTFEVNIESYFKKGMKVYCFVESRLDVKRNDN